MIFNLMVLITASFYWYSTGHVVPAILGYILLLMFQDKLAFSAILMAGAGISAVSYCFWLDYFAYQAGDVVLHHGTGIIYILVLFIKAKKIFDNDEFSLD